MLKYPLLNFPRYRPKTTLRAGKMYIWDGIRGVWLILTPEEWVRQHAIRFLLEDMGATPGCVCQEYEVKIGGVTAQRADIVVFTPDLKAVMVVECKAPDVAVSDDVLAQAIRYNSVLCARYMFITNGLNHYFYERNSNGEYTPMNKIPKLK